LKTISIFALALALAGCATLDPRTDAVEVRAEQTVVTAYDVMDTFLKLELQNRALLQIKAPGVCKFADKLRAPVQVNGKAVPWGISLIESRLAYKRNRTPDNKASLVSAVAAVETALAETNAQLASANTIK
jgi:hypothetical protein